MIYFHQIKFCERDLVGLVGRKKFMLFLKNLDVRENTFAVI